MPTFTGTTGNDILNGSPGDDILNGLAGGDSLFGDDGNDTLNGGSGDDYLNGGTGADILRGGGGDDTYIVDNAGDVVDESVESSAADRVITTVDFSSSSIEDVACSGSADINVTLLTASDHQISGNRGDNVLTSGNGDDVISGGQGDDVLNGNDGDDLLRGGDGVDRLNGGLGADYLEGGDGFDIAIYADATTGIYTRLDGVAGRSGEAVGDTYISIEGLVGSAFADVFVGSESASGDSLWGLDGADTLYGLSGDDTLSGGLGADVLNGGVGFDAASYADATTGIYTRLDGVVGASGEAVGDTYVSIEGLVGSAFADVFVGSNNVTGDRLSGLGGNDSLYGLGGADTLLGGTGDDNLYGGLGADLLNGGADFDLARYDSATTAIYTRLDGVAGQFGEAVGDTYIGIEGLVGSEFNDTFVGNNVNGDTLYGNGGADALYGLGGNDTLFGGAGGDVLNGGEGFDLARYDSASTAIYTRLDGVAGQFGEAVGDTYIGIEGLVGSAFNDTFVGNNINADSLFGLAGNDGLYGLGGVDTLEGGAGNDTLFGGAGADQFVFNTALNSTTNVDTIGDFAAGSDDIVLSQAIFAGIGATLDASEFQIGTADASTDRIIYNQATGQLFYDSNGNGAGGSTLFATVTAGTVLTLADFVMVA